MQVSLSVNVIISCYFSMTLGLTLNCGLQDVLFSRIVRLSDLSCALYLNAGFSQALKNESSHERSNNNQTIPPKEFSSQEKPTLPPLNHVPVRPFS